ncbi:MAG: hypothetical protein QF918_14430 [Pirellulaceae bacterium]|nr:hypothetical protein [Pirellulaceae bacterium]MDP6721354.1 hypothetical protein [Pirellulaceae bacterium]
MKRFVPVLLAAGLAITLAGCTPTTVSDTAGTSSNTSEAISSEFTSSNTSEATSSEFTLVTLKVPNMV